jgi:D-3-phosphoglycerate dehydrogenase
VKVLLLENVHPVAQETFLRHGFEVERRAGALGEAELIEALQGVDVVGIRSNTKVTQAVLDATPDLRAIGCFCIGTNQVDLAHATALGVGVFNAPFSNTRSVVELVIGEILALARRLPEKTQRMHDGIWDKSAKGSYETRGRTLGNMAEGIGMRVAFFDTADRLAHGNARRMGSLDELLEESDVVSLHVDGRPGNAGLFGAEQFAKMRPGSVFINASRGMVVDDVALREHLLSGHLSGAAIDVFPVEPKAQGDVFESPLRGLDNVILTPHVGGSTEEAQEEIGTFVSSKLSSYLLDGATALSVNLPDVAPAPREGSFRIALLHRNVPGVLASINRTLAEAGANVIGQSLATLGEFGYVVTDTDDHVTTETLEALRQVAEAVHLETWHQSSAE